jgi:hypothetical protein
MQRDPITSKGVVRFTVFTAVVLAFFYGLSSLLNVDIKIALIALLINWVVGTFSVYYFTEK